MIGSNSNGQLRALVERIERLNEEEKALKSDKRDVFAEAKAMGYDPKVLRRVIQIRAGDAAEQEEFETLVDTYLVALGHGGDPYARDARETAAAGYASTTQIDGVAGGNPEEAADDDGPLPSSGQTPVQSAEVGAAVVDGNARPSPPDDDLDIPAFLDRRKNKPIAPVQGEPLS